MSDWLAIVIFIVVALVIIGNFSTVQKNAKTPMRKQGLNDLKETLPRSQKEKQKLDTFKTK